MRLSENPKLDVRIRLLANGRGRMEKRKEGIWEMIARDLFGRQDNQALMDV